MRQKLEIGANVAIICIALLVAATLIRQHITHAQTSDTDATEKALEGSLSPGSYVPPPPGYQWEQHTRTLLMMLRYGCIHCEHNMDLYRGIQKRLGGGQGETHLLAVFPDDAFVAQHDIDLHGLHGLPFLADVDFTKLRAPGTPTLLLVDNRGTILRSWVGELPEQRRKEVISAIQ